MGTNVRIFQSAGLTKAFKSISSIVDPSSPPSIVDLAIFIVKGAKYWIEVSIVKLCKGAKEFNRGWICPKKKRNENQSTTKIKSAQYFDIIIWWSSEEATYELIKSQYPNLK